MGLPEIVAFVQGVGFPVFVAVYLLVFFNTTIRENTQVLRDLANYLEWRIDKDKSKHNHNGG